MTDTYEGAYECEWQNRYQLGHVSIFCSLGDWGCNLTDLLKDKRFDNLDLDNADHAAVIFRHYTKMLLVISELLTDFQDMYLKMNPGNNQSARSFYFPVNNRMHLVFNFINKACKHKTGNIHSCNHHLPIIFEDSSQRRSGSYQYLSLTDPLAAGKTAILVPKLLFLMTTLLTCYRKLNSYFRSHRPQFNYLCASFV